MQCRTEDENEQVLKAIWPSISNDDWAGRLSHLDAFEGAIKEAQSRKLLRSRAVRRQTGTKCRDYPDAVLKRVRQLRSCQKEARGGAIADKLNEEGLVTFTGKKWSNPLLCRLERCKGSDALKFTINPILQDFKG